MRQCWAHKRKSGLFDLNNRLNSYFSISLHSSTVTDQHTAAAGRSYS